MVLPKPIYESIPYAYIFAGLAALALMDSAGKYLPAFIFIATAAWVLRIRHNYRAHLAEQEEAKARRIRKLAKRLNA